MQTTTKRTLLARAVVLYLFAVFSTVVWADDVTESQARQQAQTFLMSRRNTAGGPRYAPGTPPQLTLATKVSGLYVFTVKDKGGFVIVSNDDGTVPILGYSDKGTFDAENMPANMKAWLQGYADEIAWLKEHGSEKPARLPGAPKTIGSHSTDNIAPLIETTWDQGEPYWNQTPYWTNIGGNIYISKEYLGGYTHCATGCVATAMAQVMKYHEWPQTATAEIPAYQWGGSIWLPDENTPLAATTFDWANMLNDYSGSESATQNDAVATLMKYCGYSLGMDYGPESGANTDAVAYALKNYFDYKETTRFVSRSSYTYANWTDLIYHELKNNRPVVYGGMSSGGGHEFVCDGYLYENSTDFFHINWGWGGMSDNYFVLSALDPDQQGIGGSTSDDGFHYGQDAVIGIQPSTGTGTVADIPENTIDLTLVSITSSKETVAPGESVDITVKIKNNSTDVYDGDIMLYDENGIMTDVVAKTFVIASGETKDCVFTITPTVVGIYSLIPLRNDFYYFENPIVNKATLTVEGSVPDGLTVYDGTATSQYVPAYIYYFDDFSRSQYVIPAADLAKMEGGIINGISFYTTSSNIPYTTASTVDVYLKEVDYTSISDFETKESSTTVYQGTLSITSTTGGGLMTIRFATPYEYSGGNLMIGIDNTTDAEWKQISFYGQAVAGASFAGSHSTSPANILGAQRNFIPKTTFDYTPAAGACRKPTALALVGEPTYNSAELTWTPGDEEQDAWQICVNGDEDYLIDVNTIPYTLTGLTQDTEYRVKVRSNCGGGNVSSWSNEITFTTAEQYAKPTDMTVSNVTFNSADISWTGSADSYNLRYRTVEETVAFSDDFESGLGQWTIIRNGAGTASTDWRQFDPSSFSSNPSKAHSGEYVAMSRSWADNPYSVDNWLISPQVPLGGTMKYWVMDDGTYHEHYDIYVSTTTADISAFTKVYEPGDASDTWTEVTVDLSAFAGKNGYIAFRNTDNDQDYLLIDDVTITGINPTSEWVTVNHVTNPYTLTGLASNTRYQVEVQGVYAAGESSWNTTGFVTLDGNPTPSDIHATLAADGATLTWTGLGDSYHVQYRTAADEETFFYEGFENGIPNTWTTIDADADGNNWLAVSDIGTVYPYYATADFSDWSHTGSDAATSPSYVNTGNNEGTVFTSDQYLISPKLNLKGTLRFYANSIYSDQDSYEVLLSTTGKAAADFTTTLQAMKEAPNDRWDEVSIDLSAYAGQQGYIAIHHVSEDKYFLVIDDFGLYGSSTPAGEWQSITPVTEATATLSGLATNNTYEYRIQSVKGEDTSDWSETGSFTLLSLQDEGANTTLINSSNGRFAHVTLAGRTLYKDNTWNTFCVPFDVELTDEGNPLYGATAKKLVSASVTGTTLTMVFEDADDLEAGVPYLLKWTSGTNLTSPVFAGVTIDASAIKNYDNNGEMGDERVRFIGTYDLKTVAVEDKSILFMGADNDLLYPDGLEPAIIGAFRAYFKIGEDGVNDARQITGFNIDFGDGDIATGIISIDNGQVTIGNGAWYSLDGRKLSGKPTMKGVYIRNGRKTVIQ